MIEVPRITPVRIKADQIAQELIDPGSMAYYFPDSVGPRVVYLDQRYDYPEQQGNNAQVERGRQGSIWGQFRDDNGWVEFLDRRVEEKCGDLTQDVKARVAAELGHTASAEYFERVYSELLGVPDMNVVIISTGVRPIDGNNYHDIGFLR